MKATFKNTEGDYLLAELDINGKPFVVMDEFGGEWLKDGDIVQVELMNSVSDNLIWETVFSANPEHKRELEHISGWAYFAYGEIVSVNPMMCDCGLVILEGPFDTNDQCCVGEFIGFRVSRLTAFGA